MIVLFQCVQKLHILISSVFQNGTYLFIGRFLYGYKSVLFYLRYLTFMFSLSKVI